MNEEIRKLKEALSVSPDNQYLQQLIIDALIKSAQWDELQAECLNLIAKEPQNNKAKLGLAQSYFGKKNFSTAAVVLEELLNQDLNNINALILMCRVSMEENNTHEAVETYKKIKQLKPDYVDPALDVKLLTQQSKQPERLDDTSFSDRIESEMFGKKEQVTFKDVGGMDYEKEQISLKIIHPLKHADLYKSYGKKIGGGILFYGPPGCGKTFLAKATAGEIDSQFISVGIDEILDMYIGQSEKKLNLIFEKARAMSPCVLFFDEIDALGANRNDLRSSAGRNLINQFLAELDGVGSNNEGILVVGATNAPWHLDSAFRRPGRFDRLIFVQPPVLESRVEIFKLALSGKPIEKIDYPTLGKLTDGFSGADINGCIDVAVEDKLQEAIKNGIPTALQMKDLTNAIKKVKPSTKEWFQTAKNYAMYANDSGIYDEILTYLKLK
ncbi:AAA family ATPase [Chryseosolibacter indicus]|uniref:AAA family ATPase n=1 Tax=Chryseosolibacter indicus TaxID=2782351 RepID=A0ABS5VPH6_9BACT|nr:AAA family ATPase [Chryseosolibacter indicus]MBT1703347.1 AAA family ATPase [Chryseosolibacter indicus]